MQELNATPLHPDGVLDAVPDPAMVRDWLSQSVLRSELLRRLLKVAERKAAHCGQPPSTTAGEGVSP